MKKILIIHVLGFGYEGITSVIYNYCSTMKQDGLKIDFISPKHSPDELIEKFNLIGRVIEFPNRQTQLLNYCKKLSELYKNNNYNTVHIHGNSGTMMIESYIAKINHVPNVIVHCHNTKCKYPFLNKFMVPIMMRTSDWKLCCSEEAGKWLYGNYKYYVMNNAIDIKRYRFNENIRLHIREYLKIENEFVLGHIGHFTEQKNHDFLIDLYFQVVKEAPNTKLLLVGDGGNWENIHRKVHFLGLEEKVIFTGNISDPESMYCAMDIFLFPSKWEGFPLVLIEAQASGLPCIASDCVPKEGNITGNIKFINCNNIEEWKRYIVSYINSYSSEREFVSNNNIDKIQKNGYDIAIESEKLRRLYLGKDKKNEYI